MESDSDSFLSEPLEEEEIESSSSEEEQKNNKNEYKQINYTNVNFFSWLFYSWSKHALTEANKGILKTKEVSAVAEKQSTRYNIRNLQKSWEIYKIKKSKYPLIKSIFSVHFFKVFILFCLEILLITMDYIRMFFFRQILYNFSQGNFNKKTYTNFENYIKSIKNLKFDIYESVSLFIITKFFSTLFMNHLEFRTIMLSERITNEMTALLYEKILRGNPSSNNEKAEGEIMNLIQEDCEKIGFLFFIGPKVIMFPVRIIISVFLLFKLFGYHFIYGVFAIIISIIIILILQVLYLRNLNILLKKKDDRSKVVTNVFHIIKSIKLYAWENKFFDKVKMKRDAELDYTKRNMNIDLIRMLINSNLPLVLLIITILSKVLKNQPIEITNLFTANQLIASLALPLMEIPGILNEFFSNLICIDRLQKYLYSPEHDYNRKENRGEYLHNNILVKFNNTTFGIDLNQYLEHEKNQKDEEMLKKTILSSSKKLVDGNKNHICLLEDINLIVLV